jgi:GT2 family glycosyltransferase
MRGTVYAMISTRKSEHYTHLALTSFLKYTSLGQNDIFYLIDNDNTGVYENYKIKLINNNQPQSFAKNINDVIDLAKGRDIVILSNDVVFTPDWDKPLAGYSDVILLPSCNQTHLYSNENLKLEFAMNVEQFTNNQDLNNIAKQHKSSVKGGLYERQYMPFYVMKIPAKIYKQIGVFNETYGVGGGEDVDYRIRAIKAGFSVKYHSQSYLLHFQGKSTWNGAETIQETQTRDKQYFKRFSELWGDNLANLFLSGGNPTSVIEKYQLWDYINRNDFSNCIKHMIEKR